MTALRMAALFAPALLLAMPSNDSVLEFSPQESHRQVESSFFDEEAEGDVWAETCKTSQQSPINLAQLLDGEEHSESITSMLEMDASIDGVSVEAGAPHLTFKADGDSFDLVTFTKGDIEYTLDSIQLISPAEHTISEMRMDAEIVFDFKQGEQRISISVLLEDEDMLHEDRPVDKFFSGPDSNGQHASTHTYDSPLNIGDLFPTQNGRYYHYMGSNSYNPCKDSEKYVMAQIVRTRQIRDIARKYGATEIRKTQEVKADTTVDTGMSFQRPCGSAEQCDLSKIPMDYIYPSRAAVWTRIDAVCGNGDRQSPIDLLQHINIDSPSVKDTDIFTSEASTKLGKLIQGTDIFGNLEYTAEDGKLMEGNHPKAGTSVQVELQTITIKLGSEHTVNGQQFPLEIQYYFKADGSTEDDVILSTFVDIQHAKNEDFETLFLSDQDHDLALENVLPVKSKVDMFTYDGSLTVPPCTENIQWIIFSHNVGISHDQYMRVLERGNFLMSHRMLQPINSRKVLFAEDTSTDYSNYEYPRTDTVTDPLPPPPKDSSSSEDNNNHNNDNNNNNNNNKNDTTTDNGTTNNENTNNDTTTNNGKDTTADTTDNSSTNNENPSNPDTKKDNSTETCYGAGAFWASTVTCILLGIVFVFLMYRRITAGGDEDSDEFSNDDWAPTENNTPPSVNGSASNNTKRSSMRSSRQASTKPSQAGTKDEPNELDLESKN